MVVEVVGICTCWHESLLQRLLVQHLEQGVTVLLSRSFSISDWKVVS